MFVMQPAADRHKSRRIGTYWTRTSVITSVRSRSGSTLCARFTLTRQGSYNVRHKCIDAYYFYGQGTVMISMILKNDQLGWYY